MQGFYCVQIVCKSKKGKKVHCSETSVKYTFLHHSAGGQSYVGSIPITRSNPKTTSVKPVFLRNYSLPVVASWLRTDSIANLILVCWPPEFPQETPADYGPAEL